MPVHIQGMKKLKKTIASEYKKMLSQRAWKCPECGDIRVATSNAAKYKIKCPKCSKKIIVKGETNMGAKILAWLNANKVRIIVFAVIAFFIYILGAFTGSGIRGCIDKALVKEVVSTDNK
jgi:DNA-directed RNA polymerase subunit RPC12/RpoP